MIFQYFSYFFINYIIISVIFCYLIFRIILFYFFLNIFGHILKKIKFISLMNCMFWYNNNKKKIGYIFFITMLIIIIKLASCGKSGFGKYLIWYVISTYPKQRDTNTTKKHLNDTDNKFINKIFLSFFEAIPFFVCLYEKINLNC